MTSLRLLSTVPWLRIITGIYIYCKALPILKVKMISLLNPSGYIPDSFYEAGSERWGMLFLYVSKDHGLL